MILYESPKFEAYKPTKEETDRISYVKRRSELMSAAREEEIRSMEADENDLWRNMMVSPEDRPAKNWKTHIRNPLAFVILRQKLSETLQKLPDLVFKNAVGNNGEVSDISKRRLEIFKIVSEYNQRNMGHLTQLTYSFIDMFGMQKGYIETAYSCVLQKIKVPKKYKEGKGEAADARDVNEELQGDNEYDEKEIIKKDGATLISHHPKNILVDEMANDLHTESTIDSARDIIINEVLSLETFRERFKGYKNMESVVPGGRDTWDYNVYHEDTNKNTYIGTKNDNVYIKRYYNWVDDEHWIVSNGVLIRKDGGIPFSHKMLPLIELKAFPIPHTGRSVSDTTLLRGVLDLKDTLAGLAFDVTKRSLTPTTFYQGIDMKKIKWGAENEIDAGIDIRQNVMFAPTPTLGQDFERMDNKFDTEITRYAGIDINIQDVNPNERVYQTKLKREISNKLLSFTRQFNESTGLRVMYQQVTSNLMEFFPRRIARNIILPDGTIEENISYPKIPLDNFKINTTTKTENGKEVNFTELQEKQGVFSLLEIRPETIRTQLEVQVFAGSMTRELEALDREEYLSLLAQLVAIPLFTERTDLDKLYENLIKAYGKNPEDFFKKELKDEQSKYVSNIEYERLTLLSGKTPVLPKNVNHLKHFEYILAYKQTKEYKKLQRKIKDLFEKQFELHASLVGQSQFEPEKDAPAPQPEPQPQAQPTKPPVAAGGLPGANNASGGGQAQV